MNVQVEQKSWKQKKHFHRLEKSITFWKKFKFNPEEQVAQQIIVPAKMLSSHTWHSIINRKSINPDFFCFRFVEIITTYIRYEEFLSTRTIYNKRTHTRFLSINNLTTFHNLHVVHKFLAIFVFFLSYPRWNIKMRTQL